MQLSRLVFRRVTIFGMVACVSFLAGCAGVFGPSPQRLSCLNMCADEKDRCILSAQNAGQIKTCDGHCFACNQGCPP